MSVQFRVEIFELHGGLKTCVELSLPQPGYLDEALIRLKSSAPLGLKCSKISTPYTLGYRGDFLGESDPGLKPSFLL